MYVIFLSVKNIGQHLVLELYCCKLYRFILCTVYLMVYEEANYYAVLIIHTHVHENWIQTEIYYPEMEINILC